MNASQTAHATHSANAQKRIIIWVIVGMTIVALIAVASAFIGSMRPTAAAKARAIRYIDVSELIPGQMLESGGVGVYRRTPEQIARLSEAEISRPLDWMPVEVLKLPGNADPVLRSVSPEFFVFRLRRDRNDRVLLNEGGGGIFLCDDFRTFSGSVPVAVERQFTDGFQCDGGFGPYFDLAGRPSISWIWPLRVPPYRISDKELRVILLPAGFVSDNDL